MDTLWRRVSELQGKIVLTVIGMPFQVLAVDPTKFVAVKIIVGRKGHHISRREIEEGYRFARGVGRRAVSPVELRAAGVSEWYPAYVAGIVNTIRGLQ